MAKNTSRPARWADATSRARAAFDDLQGAFEDLASIREEYEEWRDNLPENMQSGALAEKLDAVVGLDFDVLSEVEGALDEAEGADLPLGFGRD